MQNTLIQMALLMLCGACWPVFNPNGLSLAQTRLVLTTSVFYFFLPVMVLEVLWQAEIGWQSLQYSLMGLSSILLCVAASWLLTRLLNLSPARAGAVILASSFGNITYLGLPVLEQTYGDWARSVVIQIDLFASTPLVYTLGIMLASHYGEAAPTARPASFLAFFNAPPFWAALLAILLNLNHVSAPPWLSGFMHTCSAAVAPLMIFSLGMALSWRALQFRYLPFVLPAALIKLLLSPGVALWLSTYMTLASRNKAAAILDIAMPSMTLGIVLCDRYKLDSSLYAMAVTFTTALSMLSLPFWRQYL
ncbi:MAG: AEC family transporter [Methylococcales bacterium]|nr:AEC family transporter [Methylococcales bacterium]